MVLAFSLQAQVEKYGAYVGIAAFFGLAVLTLLYFSQARELKRLREWAGRAPERARELEQRVVTQATAADSRRPAATPLPQRPAPPRRLAEMPVSAQGTAAQAASGGQATELAESVPADPVTNGNLPPGPGGSVPVGPQPANGAAAPADTAEPNGDAAAEEQEGERAATPEVADAPETTGEAGSADAVGAPTAPGSAEAAGSADAVGVPTAPGSAEAAVTPGAAEPPAADGPAPPAPPDAAVGEPSTAEPALDDTGEEEIAAAAVPRATPAQRPAAARRAPMPLRQSQPSAAARRPGQTAARRPGKPPREGRSAGTVALLVGLGVLILGGGAFVLSQLGGDDTPAKPNRPAQPATQSAEPTTSPDGGNQGTSTTLPAETNVAVLNGTTFTGLASKLQDRIAEQGFARGKIATNPDQSVQGSTVYYASGFRTQALRIARLLNVRATKPVDAGTKAAAPQADIVVLAGADQTP